ncbi:MAG TPA: hypothetical protein VHK24_05960, partial [Steroidobacter sp.]|nr:hypothetical protein [Steroidobacter sp.]
MQQNYTLLAEMARPASKAPADAVASRKPLSSQMRKRRALAGGGVLDPVVRPSRTKVGNRSASPGVQLKMGRSDARSYRKEKTPHEN